LFSRVFFPVSVRWELSCKILSPLVIETPKSNCYAIGKNVTYISCKNKEPRISKVNAAWLDNPILDNNYILTGVSQFVPLRLPVHITCLHGVSLLVWVSHFMNYHPDIHHFKVHMIINQNKVRVLSYCLTTQFSFELIPTQFRASVYPRCTTWWKSQDMNSPQTRLRIDQIEMCTTVFFGGAQGKLTWSIWDEFYPYNHLSHKQDSWRQTKHKVGENELI